MGGVWITGVYIDIYYITNMFSDFVMLYVLNLVLNKKAKLPRLISASAVGALYSSVVLVIRLDSRLNCVLSVIAIVIMLRIAGVSELIVNVPLMYVIAFAMAGTVYYFGNTYRGQIKLITIIECFLLELVTVYIIFGRGRLHRIRSLEEAKCDVCIRRGNKSFRGIGFYDSGNGMYEPITGSKVIVSSQEVVDSFLTDAEKEYIRLFPQLPPEWDGMTYIRGIPYNSIGAGHGIIPAVSLDKVEVISRGKTMSYNNCYLAICKEQLSMNEKYSFILHRDMR